MIIKTRGRVFGSLKPCELSILIAYGYGMNEGGGLRIFNITEVPKDCRIPNTYVWLTMERGEVLKIEKMTDKEAEENR